MTLLPLLKPRYWLLWAGIAILWCLTHLPHHWQLAIGRQFGRLTYRLAPRRRNIADTNLKLCFPELNETQRHQLLHKHFESLGMGLFEMLNAWWLPDETLKPLGQIQGMEHLDAALKRGKGVILLGAHLTPVEIGVRFLTMHIALHAIYRPHGNPLMEYFMKKNRECHAEKAITRDAVRDMLRSLKQNKPLWLATDQNFGHKHSVFVDFFGIKAATNTIISRLVQVSGATVVPFFTQRLEHHQGYKVILQAALEQFPSGDNVQDALQINQLIEAQIRKAPEQYLWVHRRFKDRPQGEASFYQ
ncbi:LpxL/LpxP family Kdo(2)-lipid IV(A) lauroyl/palmitoleoyl acyltransferase [Candidatus Parabeggiatoa sp. HSG14]|uniref:LpxL/LpxP family Kdo(2)-lipid IV(A) lauroyl/palmitoleoyl acyltransferase n=1 Tax=Candidatus Parabeggiatoa sp. HSG14 TaxID=3055593 RepID=UPI0025A819E9|nr:LpxL/LpxP family Kdo(2)-lipid IV(A) lauroyl/palmitoleoyl acyltransferase [Thiotrichales bacterium HSG14]